MRQKLKDVGIELTDVDYNYRGTHDLAGTRINAPLIPDDDTDIAAYARLLTNAKDDPFVQWLSGFDLVVLKSCFPNSNLASDEELDEQKRQIESIITNSAKLFKKVLWVTPPPLTRGATTTQSARRAQTVARWTYEHTWPANVKVFDLHTALSEVSGKQAGRLKKAYRRLPFDSHPNRKGALQAGNQLLDAIQAFKVQELNF